MAEDTNDKSDPLDGLGSGRHDAAVDEIGNSTEPSDDDESGAESVGDEIPSDETKDENNGGDTGAESTDEDPEPDTSEDDGESGAESTDEGTESEDSDGSGTGADSITEDEIPDYKATSVYLAEPELSKYQHTYFKRLLLDYPELQGCQQRELQRALLSVAMSEKYREDVRDAAAQFHERRKAQE